MKSFELETYLTKSVNRIVLEIMKASFQYPKASRYLLQYQKNSRHAAKIRQQQESIGLHIPPFLIASLTNACNLRCSGCFARASNTCFDQKQGELLTNSQWETIFTDARDLGIGFILCIGGEPLLRKEIIETAGNIPEILFPIFTNATLLNEDYLQLFDNKRNLIPVLSLEGNQSKTNQRRGHGIYEQLLQAMHVLKERQILFAASITVTSENIYEVCADSFLSDLSTRGCKSVLYIEYVPTASDDLDLALNDEQRSYLETRLAKIRSSYDRILFLSFPGDEKNFGGCLAAGRGFFHINATGGAEPCPFSPYFDTNLSNVGLKEALQSPFFKKLAQDGVLQKEHIGGCSLHMQKDAVVALLEENEV